jgi:TraM recognition site of TraD and TraG/Type IV secretory system Conjugative DNA transfer
MQKIDLDEPIIEFVTKHGKTPFTVRNALENIQVFGGIGSGKSSGSGKLLATKYLEKGWGGLVLTCKNNERDEWIEYAKQTGRENDLFILEPNGHHRFNFLSYLSLQTNGRALTDNIVDVLKTVIEATQEKTGSGGNDEFWSNALDQVLSHSIELLKMAYGRVTIEELYELTQALPKEGKKIAPENDEEPSAFYTAYMKVRKPLIDGINKWEKALGEEILAYYHETGMYSVELNKLFPDARPFKYLDEFFMTTYRTLTSKTRSIVDFNVSGFFFRLLKEPVFSLFCDGISTIKPELCTRGKIILINLPTKEFSKAGRDVQILFKYIWQKAMESREINDYTKPVFLFVDESQEFLHEYDADFQATARSCRIANVYLSQNINNYYAVMGGHKSEYKVKALLGTFGTKFFHANADIETNKYSSDLLGDTYKEISTESVTMSGDNFSKTNNKSIELEKVLRPEEFSSFATGGEPNNFKVQAIMYRQGNTMANGLNYLKVSFDQNHKPKKINNLK